MRLVLTGVCLLAICCYCFGAPRRIGGWRQHVDAIREPARPSTLNCTWRTFHNKIDHFGSDKGTFSQRLCIYDKWWSKAATVGFHAPAEAPGPILFYTGNESPIEEYVNNTGSDPNATLT